MSNDRTIFEKATLVLAQAGFVGGEVELQKTDAHLLPSICSLIDTASANVTGLSTSTAYSQVAPGNTISVAIPENYIGEVMKMLHKLHHQPTDVTVLEKGSASKLLSYIELLKTGDNTTSTAPIALEKPIPQITLSNGFGPMPSEEKESIAAVAA